MPSFVVPSFVVLASVVLLFVVLASVIAIRTPAWESSDEPDHVQNIEALVAGHWYQMRPGSGDEAHQPPLYYLAFAGWQTLIGKPARIPDPGPSPLFPPRREVFIHHRASDHRFLLWLRFPNILLGVATVVLTFFATRTITKDRWTPLVAAAIVASVPRFVFLSAFVTNDNLANTLGALLLFVSLRYVRSPTAARIAWVGAAIGLLVLTKLSALPLAAVLVVVAFRRWRHLAIGVASALAVSGWYLVQNAVRYGDPLARAAAAAYLAPIGGLGTLGKPYTVQHPFDLVFRQVPALVGRSFWYTSGWNLSVWSQPSSVPFWLLLFFALGGLVGRRVSRRGFATSATLALAGFASVWVVSFQTGTYAARLALTGLPALACLAALGLERWRPPVRFMLPLVGLVATLIAIQHDVLSIHWTS